MTAPAPMAASVQVLAFDIFGTVVDWHGSIQREVQALYPAVDGDAFARAWRAGYKPAMARVMSGELGWTLIDDLHRMILTRSCRTLAWRTWAKPSGATSTACGTGWTPGPTALKGSRA